MHLLVQAALRSTVRAGSGSGVLVNGPSGRVIVTANHNLQAGATATIRCRGRHEVHVLYQNEEEDLAILSDQPTMPGEALPVADSAIVGDPVVLGGFPLGWPEEAPLVAVGHLGGIRDHAEELWLNADSSWGHSGGPAVAMLDGIPQVIGIVLGAAGEAHAQLRQLRFDISHRASMASALMGQARQGRANVIGGESRFTNPWPVLKGVTEAAGGLVELLGWTRRAIEEHFRTGFVRARSGSVIRRRLGF